MQPTLLVNDTHIQSSSESNDLYTVILQQLLILPFRGQIKKENISRNISVD